MAVVAVSSSTIAGPLKAKRSGRVSRWKIFASWATPSKTTDGAAAQRRWMRLGEAFMHREASRSRRRAG
jgi:hypothetical protein